MGDFAWPSGVSLHPHSIPAAEAIVQAVRDPDVLDDTLRTYLKDTGSVLSEVSECVEALRAAFGPPEKRVFAGGCT